MQTGACLRAAWETLCSSEQKSFVCLLYEKSMLLVESSGARLCSGPKGKGAAIGVFEEELSHYFL